MQHETRTALISFLFVLSGLLGLVYQIVWFKYLSTFLGNTTYAQSIVLATFMGGMAIGATVWGRRADRLRARLAVYGWLELSIGFFCLIYPFMLEIIRGAFISALMDLGWTGESGAVLTAKVIVSALLLLPPTILMGGTLPVLVRAVTERFDQAGKVIATLYALNSLGAVIGAVLGGFFFIRLVGLQTTIIVAALLSMIVGVAALMLSRSHTDPGPSDEMPAELSGFSARQGMIATIVAGLSGAAAMVLEVTWVRMLIPILGSSTYSFSIMLVAFITGITLGGLYAGRIMDGSRSLMKWLLGSQLAIIAAVSGSLLLYDRLPYVVWLASSVFARNESTYPLFLVLQFVIALLWMIVPTFFFGISLPVAIRIASRTTASLGSSVGMVYTVNTTGTVVGSLAAGFVLIPSFGLSGSVLAALIILSGSAALILFRDSENVPMGTRAGSFGVIALSLAVGLFFSGNTMVPSLSGVFRLFNRSVTPPSSYDEFVSRYIPSDVVYYKEGMTATVGIVQSEIEEGTELVLIINGKSDASSVTDLPTQRLLGHLPALLHEDPDTALVIGYGSGATVAGLLKHPLERLDCVEISPEVIEASPLFEDVNEDPFSDERFHLSINDASSFVSVSRTMYDLIVSEPSNPWIAGIGSLYTEEFFRQCLDRLSPEGIMSQWFHLYEIDDETFHLVVRTFASVFPYVTIWESMSADVILLGSLQPITIDESTLDQRTRRPGVEEDLQRLGLSDPLTLLSLQVISNRNVRPYSGEGLLNTEDRPVLEFLAPRAFFVNRGVSDLDDHDERLMYPSPDTYLMRRVGNEPLSDPDLRRIGLFHAAPRRGHPYLGYFLLTDYLGRNQNDRTVLRTLARLSEVVNKQEETIGYLGSLADLDPADPDAQSAYGWALFEQRVQSGSSLDKATTDRAEANVRKAIALVGDTVDRHRIRLADIFFTTGRYALAMDQYARAIQIRESHARDPYIHSDKLFTRLAQCLYETGDRTRALGYALQAANMNPANEEAKDLIATLWQEGTGTPSDELSR